MGPLLRKFSLVCMAAVFAAVPLFSVGCAARVRVYDPYDRDYRAWAPERPYYNEWERDTHRHHMDYDHRNDADKQAYWQWRHDHGDDHDQH